MASTRTPSRNSGTVNEDGMVEECDQCGTSAPHDVRVEICTESNNAENAQFSREPYRVSKCLSCGTMTWVRMNNA